VLTLEEYLAGLEGEDTLETRFKNFDQNRNGKLSREEFGSAGLSALELRLKSTRMITLQ